MRIYLTGASGFLGRHLGRAFSEAGHEVIGLVQNPHGQDRLNHLEKWGVEKFEAFTLGKPISEKLFKEGPGILVHCGWFAAWHAARQGQSMRPIQSFVVNVEGSEALYLAALNSGCKHLLFIGSLAAHEAAESYYGQHKLSVEKNTLKLGGSVIKPGVILGPEPAANFSKYRNLVKRLQILPDFFPQSPPLQTVWVEDVAKMATKVIAENLWGRTYIAAEERGIPMRKFYQGLGVLESKKPIVISIHPPLGNLLFLALRWIEKTADDKVWRRWGRWSSYILPILRTIVAKNPIPSDSLAGWKCLRTWDTRDTELELNMKCRNFSESLLTISKIEKNSSVELNLLEWSR